MKKPLPVEPSARRILNAIAGYKRLAAKPWRSSAEQAALRNYERISKEYR